MTNEEREYLAENKAQRMMEYRNTIFEAIPEECDSEEMTISGLSVFLQAALHMVDHDVKRLQGLLDNVIELAQAINDSDDEHDQTRPAHNESVH